MAIEPFARARPPRTRAVDHQLHSVPVGIADVDREVDTVVARTEQLLAAAQEPGDHRGKRRRVWKTHREVMQAGAARRWCGGPRGRWGSTAGRGVPSARQLPSARSWPAGPSNGVRARWASLV